MRVAILCEFSGVVRDAFLRRGHDAVSCDLLSTESPGPHIQGDCRDHDWSGYDLVIAHPPCTHLCSSGARWFAEKREDGRQKDAIEFFLWFTRLQMKWCIENPVGIMSSLYRRPDQIIQPWEYGHPETKATCLWLNNLPALSPTNVVEGRANRVHREPPRPDRWKRRSVTFTGIAEAMADQWTDNLDDFNTKTGGY